MKFIFPIFSLFVSFVIFAQDPVEIQDPHAESYLKNISKDLKTESPYRIEFKYEIYSFRPGLSEFIIPLYVQKINN